jgi:uncharacterized membrane protein YjjB (DUF3815 family)
MSFESILDAVLGVLVIIPEAILDVKAIILKAHTSKVNAAALAATDAAALTAQITPANAPMASAVGSLVSGEISSIGAAFGKGTTPVTTAPVIAPGSPNKG